MADIGEELAVGFAPEWRDLSDLAFAEALARRAHANQRERFGGGPYVEHLARVCNLVNAEHPWNHEVQTVAWLHDIIEGTPVTLGLLRALGFSQRVVRAVGFLTRKPEFESYNDYIRTIVRCGDLLALTVKLADLRDHLRADGPVIPSAMRIRYMNALHVLQEEHP